MQYFTEASILAVLQCLAHQFHISGRFIIMLGEFATTSESREPLASRDKSILQAGS